MALRAPGTITPTFDTTVAHQARIYNYWLGGKDNYAADRKAAEEAVAAYPGVATGARAGGDGRGRPAHQPVQPSAVHPRSHAEVTRFFDALELLEPGVVRVEAWRPEPGPGSDDTPAMWGGVAVKH